MGLKIGLTGQIGTGKSTIGRLLKKKGALIIEADEIAGRLLNTENIREKIRLEMPSSVIDQDGTINKKKLGHIVFNDPQALSRLENILHPPTIQIIQKELNRGDISEKEKIIVCIVPLLLETRLNHLFDKIILAQSHLENQLSRCQNSLGLKAEETMKRISRQMPQHEQMKFADYIVQNDGELEELEEQMMKLWNHLIKTLKQGEK